jgi:hypothetical protein
MDVARARVGPARIRLETVALLPGGRLEGAERAVGGGSPHEHGGGGPEVGTRSWSTVVPGILLLDVQRPRRRLDDVHGSCGVTVTPDPSVAVIVMSSSHG